MRKSILSFGIISVSAFYFYIFVYAKNQ